MRRMYFIGVSTSQSSIRALFPKWAALAGLCDAELVGVDIPVGSEPAIYRSHVSTILGDFESDGALVTTHKVDVYRHARDLFAELDADAAALGEISCIVRRGGQLHGSTPDVLTTGLAFKALIDERPFRGQVLIMGAGGAGIALAVNLHREHPSAHVTLTDISVERLQQARLLTAARVERVARAEDHDCLLGAMPQGSIIVNATGMGKDRPGSPISPSARFPPGSIAWDLNYRGELSFLAQARQQGARAADGWECFLHGWSQTMSRVYRFSLTSELFAAMRREVEALRPASS
jgi:shikimate dehydrogenase